MKRIILRSFDKMPQLKLNNLASTVATKMAQDPRFAAYKPEVDELKALNEAFTTALALATKGGTEQTAIKNDCLKSVADQLDDIADAVEKLAKGNKIIAIAAGFEVYREPTRITELSAPTGLEVENINRTGVFKLIWKKVEGAVNYGIEYQVVGEEPWRNGTYSTKQGVVMSGFKTGTLLHVKVCALGRNALKSDFSEPVTILVT